jgi:ATP-dependent protease HslVU (ClpYQ) peptidase subunit
MTTIAANRKEMAADSKCSDGGVYYASRKIWRFGDVIVGVAGDNAGTLKFVEWLKQGDPDLEHPKFAKDSDWSALVVTPAGLFVYCNDCLPDEILSDFFAIGSGAAAALAAMHLGCSPTDAVGIACKVDNGTGAPVQTMSLSDATPS